MCNQMAVQGDNDEMMSDGYSDNGSAVSDILDDGDDSDAVSGRCNCAQHQR